MILTWLSFPLLAQEIPASLKADKLKFYEGTGILEAQGSVEVELEGIKIQADSLKIDQNTKLVTAEGKVRVVTEGYRAQGKFLTYQIRSKIPTFSDFQAALSPKTVKGKVYVSAQSLTDLKEKMSAKRGALTTCDLSSPHYFLLANKVEYYPEDHLDAWGVTAYVGNMPLLWLPFLRYDFKRKWEKNWIFGHNEVEGDYLKTAWDYPGGLILLDYMEKKGWGTGVNTGPFYFYFLDEKDTGLHDRIAKFDHQQPLSSQTNLTLSHRYFSTYLVPSGRLEQTSWNLGLEDRLDRAWNLKLSSLDDRAGFYQKYALQFNRSFKNGLLNYSFNYDASKVDPKWMRKFQRFNFVMPLLGDKIRFNTSANYYHSTAYAGDLGEERVEPQVELNGQEANFSWRLTRNWFIDFRQNLSEVPRYEFLEKQPELEIYPKSLNLGLFNLQSVFGFGRYREVKNVPQLKTKRDFTAERGRISLNASKTLPLGLGTNLLLAGGIDQFFYSPGDQLYALRESANLQTNLFSFFRNDLNFRQGYTEGNTPFLFDQLGTRYHDLTEKMTFYYLDKFSWSIEGGHNWQTNRYYDLMTNLLVAPDKRLRWTATTGWDLENRRYKDLITSLRLAPYSFLATSFSLVQDLNGAGLKQGSAFYDFYLLEGAPNQWHFQISQVFDTQTKEFKVRDIMVLHDLHCWEMKASYNDYRKEISLVFALKAIPEEPVGYAPGRGFYFEGFEKDLKEFKREGEVRRY
jgi:hypothetical protein